jgi:TPR repeat protein
MEEHQLMEELEAVERESIQCPLCVEVIQTHSAFLDHLERVHDISEEGVEGGEGGGAGAGVSREEAVSLAIVRKLFNLGLCYATGKGVEKDEAEAARLYGQAAKQGHANAQYNLGLCHTHGKGVEEDEAKAARLYRQAALQGDAGAQYHLSIYYALGKGTEADKAQAARLFWQAAEQDIADAQWWLGWCYEHGQGTGQHASAAVEQYRRAVAGGCAVAFASLGLCFEKGRGVPRSDSAEAARLYALAAEGGASGEEVFDEAMDVLPNQSLAPDVPSAAAMARTRRAVYSLNLAARLRHVAATQQLEALAGRRDVVSACCVGCGAVRSLKTCNKCRVARFCDMECTARVWTAHKASCKAWRADSAGTAS